MQSSHDCISHAACGAPFPRPNVLEVRAAHISVFLGRVPFSINVDALCANVLLDAGKPTMKRLNGRLEPLILMLMLGSIGIFGNFEGAKAQ